MLVPKRLWTLPGSTTSCLQPRKAGHFPKTGAVPSVFSFFYYRKLAESEGKRLQRRRSLCQEAFSSVFFQVALGRAPGLYTQCVCEVKIERHLAFKKLGFLERQSTVSSFLFKYSFRRAIIQLEFQ